MWTHPDHGGGDAPPEVFVRSLSHPEAVKLKRMSSRAEHQSTRIRAAILLASNLKTPVPQIARMWLTDESHVRKVIHEFNEEGFDSLRPEYRGGRPPGSPPPSASVWWRWPVPSPTAKGCRWRAGRWTASPPTWPNAIS